MQELLDFIKSQIELGALIGVSVIEEVSSNTYIVDYWVTEEQQSEHDGDDPVEVKAGKQLAVTIHHTTQNQLG